MIHELISAKPTYTPRNSCPRGDRCGPALKLRPLRNYRREYSPPHFSHILCKLIQDLIYNCLIHKGTPLK
jgi:hypothetical protein